MPCFRSLGFAATIAAITWISPATLRAEGRKALMLDLNYSTPLEWTVGAAFYRSNQFWDEGGRGLVGGGRLGKHGMQAWGGWAGLGGPSNVDARGVLTRTWESPLGASANSMYLGGEVGWSHLCRFSAGYAKRIDGPSTSHGHIVTLGIGVELPLRLW